MCLLDTFQHGADRFRASHDMRVQVRHFLLPHTSCIDNHTKAVRTALSYRNFVSLGQNPAEHLRIVCRCRCQRCDVLLGNYQNMDRPSRVDIVEGNYLVVFLDLLRGDLSIDYLAKNAIAHLAPRAAFSSIPEMPSRRRISWETSSMLNP